MWYMWKWKNLPTRNDYWLRVILSPNVNIYNAVRKQFMYKVYCTISVFMIPNNCKILKRNYRSNCPYFLVYIVFSIILMNYIHFCQQIMKFSAKISKVIRESVKNLHKSVKRFREKIRSLMAKFSVKIWKFATKMSKTAFKNWKFSSKMSKFL